MIPHEFNQPRGASPGSIAAYRNTTATMVVFSWKQVQCAGPCKKRRSQGQFIEGDDFCEECRKRRAA